MCTKTKLDHFLTLYTRINSKWIRDLYIIQETIIILEENIGRKISDIAHRNFLLGYLSRQEKQKKKKINKWDYIKLKSFCTAKEIINKIKRQPMEWENIFSDTFDKGLIYNIYKVLTKLNTKTINKSIKKWAKT